MESRKPSENCLGEGGQGNRVDSMQECAGTTITLSHRIYHQTFGRRGLKPKSSRCSLVSLQGSAAV